MKRHTRCMARTIVAASVALILASCGSSEDTAGHDAKPATAGTTANGTSSASGYPATVKQTAYGPVTVKSKPKRIVSMGASEADMLVSMGIQPIAVLQDPNDFSRTPWLKGRFTGKLDTGLWSKDAANVERILSLDPDLVEGTHWDINKESYRKLSSVVPTYGGHQAGLSDWKDTMTDLSILATGSDAKAKEVIANVDKSFEETRASLKRFDKKTYNYVTYGAEDNSLDFKDGRGLKLLGLVPAAGQNDESMGAISMENMGTLTSDVLVIYTDDAGRKELEANPLYRGLPAVKNGTVIFADDALAWSLQGASPLSLEYMKSKIVPQLKSSKINTGAAS